MKKLCICRACKRRFLTEPGRDVCPKCGGVLFKTDLEEQYWDLYTDEQKEAVVSRLMAEMEAGSAGSAGSYQNTGSAPGGGGGSGRKKPAVLLGAAALIILIAAAGIAMAGRNRGAAEPGPETSAAAESRETKAAPAPEKPAPAQTTEVPSETETEEETAPAPIELFRDQGALITRDAEKEFPYTDENGNVIYAFRITNLSAADTEFKLEQFLIGGIQFLNTVAEKINAGESADVMLGVTEYELKAAGIGDAGEAAITFSAREPQKLPRMLSFETEGYAASLKTGQAADAALVYADEQVVIRTRGMDLAELPGRSEAQPCVILTFENLKDKGLQVYQYAEEPTMLNGEEIFFGLIAEIAPHCTALAPGTLIGTELPEKKEEYRSLSFALEMICASEEYRKFVLITIEQGADGLRASCRVRDVDGDWADAAMVEPAEEPEAAAGDAGDAGSIANADDVLSYILSHQAAAQEQPSAAAGTAGAQTGTKPYAFHGIVLDMPEDAVMIEQGDTVYAAFYTRDSMDLIGITYRQTGRVDFSVVRQVTKADLESSMAARGIPGFDGVLGYTQSELDGYPVTIVSYHMGTDDPPTLVTEKCIYLDNGYYSITAFDKTKENTGLLNAVLESAALKQ